MNPETAEVSNQVNMISAANSMKLEDYSEVSFTEVWRREWLQTVAHLRKVGTSSGLELAATIERLVQESAEAEERDRAEQERRLREETGTVAEVASRTGYSTRHLYSLLDEGKLTDHAAPGEPSRLRFAEVWALRGVPLAVADLGRGARPSAPEKHRSTVQHRVTARVIE